jgi:hypothetical protein
MSAALRFVHESSNKRRHRQSSLRLFRQKNGQDRFGADSDPAAAQKTRRRSKLRNSDARARLVSSTPADRAAAGIALRDFWICRYLPNLHSVDIDFRQKVKRAMNRWDEGDQSTCVNDHERHRIQRKMFGFGGLAISGIRQARTIVSGATPLNIHSERGPHLLTVTL